MEDPKLVIQAELSTTVRASRWGEIVEAGGGDGAAEGTSINIEIDSVSVIFSPYWHIHPSFSSFIYIHDKSVSSLHSGSENDGIDPDC